MQHRALLIIKLHVGKMMYARFKYMFACIVFFPMLLFNILFDCSALNTVALGFCCIFPMYNGKKDFLNPILTNFNCTFGECDDTLQKTLHNLINLTE